MNRGNTSNDGNRNSESDSNEGWGSKLLKVASAAAAAAAVAGSFYALMSSNKSEHQSPFEAHAAHHDDDDDDETPPSQIWTKPKFGWQKLKVDGSLDPIGNPRTAGCGGVLIDASGTWRIGFAQKLNPSYGIHMIELEAILKGMELAREMNVKKLVVESDRKTAVSMVKEGLENKIFDPHYNIVNSIRELLFDQKWEVKLDHIERTANKVANRLAGIARRLPFEYMEKYHSPPPDCAAFLQELNQVGYGGYY